MHLHIQILTCLLLSCNTMWGVYKKEPFEVGKPYTFMSTALGQAIFREMLDEYPNECATLQNETPPINITSDAIPRDDTLKISDHTHLELENKSFDYVEICLLSILTIFSL